MECDFLVVGGGVVGLSLARALGRRHHGARVVVLEKEPRCGEHASGRNSGVLHAGFYYTAESLKARLCRDGNAAMTAYCLERGLRINRCGKLVVAKDASQLAALDELLRRGRMNGVAVEEITAAAAREIEPRVRTHERALWSPTTSSVDPAEVMASLERDAVTEGVVIRTGTAYLGRERGGVRTSAGTIAARMVVNAAGLHADRIAHEFGFGRRYTILPFNGLYLYSSDPAGSLRTHVYPVPDLGFPFLGVHFTVTVDGTTKIGPTAIPALWREQYGGLARFSAAEVAAVLRTQMGLVFRAGFDFRGLAVAEGVKNLRRVLVHQAKVLCDGVRLADYRKWGRPGIRAQLLDVEQRTLVNDFVIEGDGESMHVLNAVSPAFTCVLPFAEWVSDHVDRALTGSGAHVARG